MPNQVVTLYSNEAKTDAIYPRTTLSAVTDSQGNALSNVATLTYTQKGSGIQEVETAINMDLLWTNSSPASSFTAQTISLNLSDYKYVYMISEVVINTSVYFDSLNFIELTPKRSITYASNAVIYRAITVSNSGIAFGNGTKVTTYGSSAGTDNTLMIPIKIYGIK